MSLRTAARLRLPPSGGARFSMPGIGHQHSSFGGFRWNSTKPPVASSSIPTWLRKGVVLTLKLVFLWLPAAAAWTVVGTGATLDLRSPEELQQEEREAQRLERFFDVEHLPEAESLSYGGLFDIFFARVIDLL